LAVWLYTSVFGSIYTTDVTADMALWNAMLFELLIAGALGLVFLTVSTSKDYKGSVVNGAVIGLSLSGMLYMSGLYNPAIALGSLLFQLIRVGGASIAHEVIVQYVVGPLLGGAAAAFAYDFFHPKK